MPISIIKVLQDIGVDVDEGEYAQQMQCPFHGSGNEMHKSARVYPATNSWYCFTEGKSYSPVATVAIANEVSFSQAYNLLKSRYGVVDNSSTQSSENIMPKIADMLSCLSTDDFLSSELDSFMAHLARGYSVASLETEMDSIIRKRWARLV